MRAVCVVSIGLVGLALSACGNDGESGAGSGGTPSTGGSTASGGSGGSAGTATGGSGGSAGTATGGSGGATGGSGGATGGAGGLDACGNAKGQLFPPGSIWNTPVDSAVLDSESSTIVSYLQQNHTASARFQIDYSFQVLTADSSTPHQSFTPTNEFYSPDCDPAPPPVPAGGKLEGMPDYTCSGGEDCHLIVVDKDECRLFEMWRANIGSTFTGGCQAVWDLKTVYPATERGEYCTSADAAGLPIAAHLFSADEIQAGAIEHALRFILPNSLIRADIFVHPATHSTSSTSGPASAPPYGARLRLKASTDVSGLNSAAQVVAKALKKYGMILSDGGNITFTATADDFTTAKWASVGLGPHDLKSLQWSDFEVVDGGARIDRNDGSCSHTPVTQ